MPKFFVANYNTDVKLLMKSNVEEVFYPWPVVESGLFEINVHEDVVKFYENLALNEGFKLVTSKESLFRLQIKNFKSDHSLDEDIAILHKKLDLFVNKFSLSEGVLFLEIIHVDFSIIKEKLSSENLLKYFNCDKPEVEYLTSAILSLEQSSLELSQSQIQSVERKFQLKISGIAFSQPDDVSDDFLNFSGGLFSNLVSFLEDFSPEEVNGQYLIDITLGDSTPENFWTVLQKNFASVSSKYAKKGDEPSLKIINIKQVVNNETFLAPKISKKAARKMVRIKIGENEILLTIQIKSSQVNFNTLRLYLRRFFPKNIKAYAKVDNFTFNFLFFVDKHLKEDFKKKFSDVMMCYKEGMFERKISMSYEFFEKTISEPKFAMKGIGNVSSMITSNAEKEENTTDSSLNTSQVVISQTQKNTYQPNFWGNGLRLPLPSKEANDDLFSADGEEVETSKKIKLDSMKKN